MQIGLYIFNDFHGIKSMYRKGKAQTRMQLTLFFIIELKARPLHTCIVCVCVFVRVCPYTNTR